MILYNSVNHSNVTYQIKSQIKQNIQTAKCPNFLAM